MRLVHLERAGDVAAPLVGAEPDLARVRFTRFSTKQSTSTPVSLQRCASMADWLNRRHQPRG